MDKKENYGREKETEGNKEIRKRADMWDVALWL